MFEEQSAAAEQQDQGNQRQQQAFLYSGNVARAIFWPQ
jgi:hypothetical protein